MPKKIVIIGAGVAGLTAGCYAQMNGYASEIFEMHNLPGGLCTSWQRQGYTFDGCISWLIGSKPGTAMHGVWRSLGALTDQPIHHLDEFIRVTGPDGRTAIQYTDLDQLKQHLLELAPDDKGVILELIESAGKLMDLEMPVGKPQDLFGPLDGLKMAWEMRPFMKIFMKYMKISIGEYTARFQDPLLRDLFTAVLDPRYNMVALLATMGSLAAKDAGWPRGGSFPFARGMAQRYQELGGELHYKARVTKIQVQENKAVGIELADGRQVKADAVISAADGYTTLYKLLGEQYVPPKIARYYSDEYPTITSVMVFLGIDHDFSNYPHNNMFPLDPPLEMGGKPQYYLGFKNYSFDSTLSLPGKSVVASVFYADFDYWQELAKDRENYETEKKRIAKLVVQELEKQFPKAAGKVEVTDVVTPLTFTRYTGIRQGAYMSWITTPKSGNIIIPKRLPKLKNFYMAGVWTHGSGGLPGSAITGRSVIQILCSEDKKEFSEEQNGGVSN